MTAHLLLLGATGDLTARYLLPALAHVADHVPGGVHLVGVAADDVDEHGFREHVRTALASHAPDAEQAVRDGIADRSDWVRGDVTDPATLARALALTGFRPDGTVEADTDDPVVLYLALPNGLFDDVVAALGDTPHPPRLRVVLEKPFGTDEASARELNAALARVVPEELTFRVDHFLAKQTVLNVLGIRFANRVFESVWNRSAIESVDIVFDEVVDAQARSSYYDRAGALRDMVQNHLLQILAYVAMEPPLSTSPEDLARRKADVLRAVRSMSPDEVAAHTVRGRYTAGRIGDGEDAREVAAYVDAAGVDPDRGTESYAEVVLHVDNWRWAGVPFRLRTGKALAENRREVVVRFAAVPFAVFDGGPPAANELRMRLDPDQLSLWIQVNGHGNPFELEPVDLSTDLARQRPGPYGQLLLAIVEGDTRLSARAEEAEQGWRIVEPILAAWADGVSPLVEYAAGSDGPTR